MRRIITWVLASLVCSVGFGVSTHASSLQIQPALYKDIVLKAGEKSKAYVDISNPTAMVQEVKLKVQRYKQIDDSGTLNFFDDESVSKGIKLDLDDFELNPHDTIRVFFLLDGSLLPSGDIFAAIFARTVPPSGIASQAVQVGTLLSVVNGTPASHSAEIAELSAPFFQWGDSVDATIVVKNPAPESSATGFFPELTVALRPYDSKTVAGPLVFAGRSRTVGYTQKGNYFGLVRLSVTTNGGKAGKWIVVATGYWRWLAPVLLLVVTLSAYFAIRHWRNSGIRKT